MKNILASHIRICFAKKLDSAGDTVGATLTLAGLPIHRNKKRDDLLAEAAKETDSVKTLVAPEFFG